MKMLVGTVIHRKHDGDDSGDRPSVKPNAKRNDKKRSYSYKNRSIPPCHANNLLVDAISQMICGIRLELIVMH